MDYEYLKEAIQSAQCDVSDVASSVLDYVLDRFDGEEEIDEDDVYDAIREESDSYFIYYDDAYDYLRDNCITDFDEAIGDGCTSVCSIAYYYLVQEIEENLRF